jgi:hypothetical protein
LVTRSEWFAMNRKKAALNVPSLVGHFSYLSIQMSRQKLEHSNLLLHRAPKFSSIVNVLPFLSL